MSIDRPPTRPPDGSAPTGLTLTGDFQVIVAGHRVEVPHAVERLLAFLALTGHAVHRSRLAGTLWADASERQAANNLRTALWRLRRGRTDLVAVQPDRLGLAPDRERFRLLRLEALEYAAGILIERGHPAEALLAALAAVDTEPLRESARRLVLRIHAGEGNAVEAVRA